MTSGEKTVFGRRDAMAAWLKKRDSCIAIFYAAAISFIIGCGRHPKFMKGRNVMGIVELILLSAGLAMDAFSVAVCKGLSMKRIDYKGAIITALFFGGFQALMPLIGYMLGSRFEVYITSFSHWVAFILLGFIGGKMIYEALHDNDDDESSLVGYRLNIRELFILSIATSIDALAVGIVFATEKTNIGLSVALIGVITFGLSFAGVIIGNKFGSRYEKKAETAGGIVLILIGVKLLLEGLGII